MNSLPKITKRRLQQIPQVPSVWEGDRRPLSGISSHLEPDVDADGECIIWVDGSEGFVRAMDVVAPEMGLEAVARTLLRAIENPHSPAQPSRPQKIVVRDREIQFFLRGVFQDLDITIDYEPELPLIDELFRGLESADSSRFSTITPQYERLLREVAREIWNSEPWELLADYDIICVEIDRLDLEPIYVCVMGMLGREYGIIFYRSLDSMKQFRSIVLTKDLPQELERAFLQQDCWFLNFEPSEDLDLDEDEEEEIDLTSLHSSDIIPVFGSIHPYEGMRPLRDEEEAIAIYVVLKALLKFVDKREDELAEEAIEEISDRYKIKVLKEDRRQETIPVKISTMPKLAQELSEMVEMSESANSLDRNNNTPIKDDLIPEGSYISLGVLPWEVMKELQQECKIDTQSLNVSRKGEGMPVILIQTSRPKAKTLIERIETAGGLKAICFNQGEDSFTETIYDLGILQTGNGHLYLFGEYIQDDPKHVRARKKWNQRCQKTNGSCAVIIAMGATGASRGNPKPRDMMALFAAKAMDARDLGMGSFQLVPHLDVDW